ncbi:MAG: hypothetical protein HY234_04960 [Acidobacteria bacterium]|nr:hypothetical protein [Acidobacteriota bacterium]
MTGSMRKWLAGAFLLGALAFVGASNAQAQYRRYTQDRRGFFEPRPGTRADYREDQRELRILQDRIWRDKEQLRADILRFGKRSPQVRADREMLARDQRELRRLRADMRYDRRLAHRRHFRWRR